MVLKLVKDADMLIKRRYSTIKLHGKMIYKALKKKKKDVSYLENKEINKENHTDMFVFA